MKEEKNGSKGKLSIFYKNILKNVQVFNGYPCKNIFAYSFVSEYSKYFFFILRKNLHF